MFLEMKEKIICCVIATILIFIGMYVETPAIDSSFSNASKSTNASISSVNHIAEDVESCTVDMLRRSTSVLRGYMENSGSRWNDRANLIFLVVGLFLQYLLYYQSMECKEDGQLLLCRSVAINYIHHKDGEK